MASLSSLGPGSGEIDADQPKRRACDECRFRKLACTKEKDGCVRCKKENIRCYYSPQKQMGRPRKRQHVEIEGRDTHSAAVNTFPSQATNASQPVQLRAQALEQGHETYPFIFPGDGTLGMDLDMSFMDVGDQNFNFLDLLDPGQPLEAAHADGADANSLPKERHDMGQTSGLWHMSHFGNPINFDDTEPHMPPPAPAPGFTVGQVANMISADIDGRHVSQDEFERRPEGGTEAQRADSSPDASDQSKPPSLSPPSTSSNHGSSTAASPSSGGCSALPATAPTCGCLASLYLALDSLQNLPSEVGAAMKVARGASKAAHDVVMCKACGEPPLEVTHTPPPGSFQNMMLLGALLPSVSNAYVRILAMVEAEVSRATAAHEQLHFSLRAYGGVWGKLATMDSKCGALDRLDDVRLEPAMWRLTVRSLLKLDVYGLNERGPSDGSRGPGSCDMAQPGLKDVIALMEKRSRDRHEMLDAMVASGVIERPPHDHEYRPLWEEKPTCMRIIDIAKRSMNDLVIP